MRIELPFFYNEEDFKTFEEVVKFIKEWERKAAKNRRFKGVKIPKVAESPQTGWPIVTFDGEEDALRKLFNYYMGLTKRDKHITADFDSVVVSEEKIDEVDYGKNNTRRKHFVAADKPTRYWIAAAEQNPENITHFVKIDWGKKRPICVPTSVVDDTARADMKPFMTTDPAKIHAVALMASKLFPKFHLNIQAEDYRETSKSRWTNTARPHGMGIEWDPKMKHWFGLEDGLPPPKPIAKKDDLGYDKKADSKAKSKFEEMDPRKLPYEKDRLEKELSRFEKQAEAMRNAGRSEEEMKRVNKQIETLKADLAEIERLTK